MNIELKERSRDDLLEIISAKDMKITMQKIEIEEIRKELINQDKYIGKLKEEYANQLQQKENIIKEAKDFINGKNLKENEYRFAEDFDFAKLLEILGDDKS